MMTSRELPARTHITFLNLDRFENYYGHPPITKDLFGRHPDMLEKFRREMVILNMEILDEHSGKVWIELKGNTTDRAIGFAFINNNPDFNNFKQALIGELEEMGIALVE